MRKGFQQIQTSVLSHLVKCRSSLKHFPFAACVQQLSIFDVSGLNEQKLESLGKISFSSQNCSCARVLHPTLLAHPIMGLMLGYAIKSCTSSAKKLKVWSNDIRARHPLKISLRMSYNLPFIAKAGSFMLYTSFFFSMIQMQNVNFKAD